MSFIALHGRSLSSIAAPLCGVLLTAFVCGACSGDKGARESRVIRESAVELLFDEQARTVVIESAERPVSVKYLRLAKGSFNAAILNGARELPALMMPAPAMVDISVPAGDRFLVHGGFALDADDVKSAKLRGRISIECAIDLVQGDIHTRLFSTILQADHGGALQAEWQAIEVDGKPLEVAGGSMLRFSTEVIEGAEVAMHTRPLAVGIGGLSLQELRSVDSFDASAERPNVIVVVMDTLRADRTSTFGYEHETTPRLDELAARGIKFDGARSTSSWTWPSTASLLTGLLPAEHGVERPGESWLRDAHVTLPEYMQRAGMATAAFTGNRLVSADFNFDQGFQTFRGPNRNEFIDGAELMPPALQWLDEHKDERFFLYLHLVDPHRPFAPLPESKLALPGERPDDLGKLAFGDRVAELQAESWSIPDRSERPLLTSLVPAIHMPWVERSYDQAIHTGDFWLGAVMDKVESLGLRENTVIVFTSDHGEETYEHGDIGHGQGLFPELMHIPLVLAGPGIAAGASTDRIVSNADIFGYLSALAEGQDASTNRQPLTANESAVFYSTERGQWKGERMVTLLGIEEQDWALHFAPKTDELMLFDLKIDPNQFVDVAKENLGVANRMKEALLERYKEALRVRLRGVGLGAGAGAIEALQDIGYL